MATQFEILLPYDIGQEVYVLVKGSAKKARVSDYRLFRIFEKPEVNICLEEATPIFDDLYPFIGTFDASQVFGSIDALIDSLLSEETAKRIRYEELEKAFSGAQSYGVTVLAQSPNR